MADLGGLPAPVDHRLEVAPQVRPAKLASPDPAVAREPVADDHPAGGIAEAYRAVRAARPDLPVEVEADSADAALAAVDAGAELVLLDNMPVAEMRDVVKEVGGRAKLEASGGLTLANARAVAETGVEYLAVGALTHSAPILDIACDLREKA